jgi:hypothetical protein
MQLGFGRSRGVPEGITTAWGARLIAPDDLLHDRQDLVADSPEAKAELIEWLNGDTPGNGAITKMREWLRDNYFQLGQNDDELVLYNDIDGMIIGSTQGSGGYVYVAGWLKPGRHEARAQAEGLRDIRRATEIGRMHDALSVDHYEVVRMPITVERWHTHYGWSEAEAEKFGEGSSEVRVFAVYPGGARRELESSSGRAGGFEMGYGGSGPHETARAIVADRDGGDRTPADLQRLVPEVFSPAGRETLTLSVSAVFVDARLSEAAA